MYGWRKMTVAEREAALERRKTQHRPWHSPPHREGEFTDFYLITAACFEHRPIIGKSPDRMAELEQRLLTAAGPRSDGVFAWCILPNHYHVLLKTEAIKGLLKELGLMHGRSSHDWNGEDATRGRQVWFGVTERAMKSERHVWTTLNYVHHNPVHHGCVEHWQDWPYSSANSYIENVGREKAVETWKQYPLLDYGKKWDVYG